MPLTKQEQEELNSLRAELGYGPLGEPIAGVSVPTYTPEETRKTAMQVGAEVLPMAGSIGATLLPGVGQLSIPARMLVSGGGAAVGDVGKQAIETFGLGVLKTPIQRAQELATEFGLGAAAEGIGQTVGRGLQKGASALRESSLGQRLFGPVISQADEMAARQEVQRLLQRQGTTLGIQEAEPTSTLFKVTERVSRIGPTKAATAKDVEFKNALSKEVEDLADQITTDVFSRAETGNKILAAQQEGKNLLYTDYGNKLEKIMDKAGAIPVNTTGVQNIGKAALAKAQEALQEGTAASSLMGTQGATEAQSLINLRPEISFKTANEVRSKLLEKQREFEKGTVAYNLVREAVTQINNAMDAAAEASSPALKEQYRTLSSSYKQAINELEPRILANGAKKDPEKIADSLVNAKSVTAWKDFQTGLNRAKSLGVDTTGIAENVQRAYLEKTFADKGITNIQERLKDKAFLEQFNAVLPESVRNRAKTVAKAGAILSERGKSIDLATAAQVAGASSGAIGAYLSGGDATSGFVGAAGGILGLILAPQIAVKIAYSPALTNKILAASSDITKGNTAAATAKLLEMYRQVKTQPAIQQQTMQGTTPLSEKEQQELQQLREELGLGGQ